MLKIKKSNEIWWEICDWNCQNDFTVKMEDGEKYFTATPTCTKSWFLFSFTFSEYII